MKNSLKFWLRVWNGFLCSALLALPTLAHGPSANETEADTDTSMQWAAIKAPTKEARTALVNEGFSIESIVEEMAYGVAPQSILAAVNKLGFEIKTQFPLAGVMDFPREDSIYHNYAEQEAAITSLASEFPGLVHKFSLGKSLEGREIWAARINPHAENATAPSALPGIVFMGGHHAREHLSVEVPLKLIRYLAEGFSKDETIRSLLDKRDVYIIPSVNPDGSEFDIAGSNYRSWRKNRRENKTSCAGVDLNRNYGFRWGTGGSSKNPCSDVFMGAEPFSEPETKAIKAFVESRLNLKILLSFHTFSELVLYPWGYTYDDISNPQDLATFQTMANRMASWNGYTPQASSDLYITTGDTSDWAYGQLGIFSFTFELSPKEMREGGFYPGANAVERTFQANTRPALYLIDLADNPHRAHLQPETTLFYGK